MATDDCARVPRIRHAEIPIVGDAAEDREHEPATTFDPAGLHTSIGVTILALAVLRVLWRLVDFGMRE